jgi:hypothetical protein
VTEPGFDRRGLPFGPRPPGPVNRDVNAYAQEGQDPEYLRNSDALSQPPGEGGGYGSSGYGEGSYGG